MATTTKKSSTTKKTKTVKKSPTKVTKKTVSKKVVKPAVAKKAVASKTTVVKPTAAKSVMDRLFRWNISMAVLHAVQAALVLWLAKPGMGLQTVTTNYLSLDSLASTTERPVLVATSHSLFDINLAWLIVAFFAMSAIAHVSIATWYRKRYEAGLSKGINKARWIEYSLSASTMMVAIALLAGVFDLGSLIMMFALTSVMNLLGLVMEIVNQGKSKVDWSSYIVGCISGIAPWIVYAIYIIGSGKYGEGGGPPSFVYAILVSIFLFFNCFAVNMYLQYAKKGKWAEYLYGEKVYMILSLVAKSVLAWQVFAGILRP